MTTSLIIKSPSASTDTTLPKVLADSLLNTGSLFLMDFLRLGCWNPATDTVADGAAVRNLVTGGTAGMLKIPVAGDLTFETGLGFKLKSSVAYGRVQIDTGTRYFQTNLTDDYLLIAWATYPASDPTGHIGQLISKAVNSTYFQAGPMLAVIYTAGGKIITHMDAEASNGKSIVIGSPAGKHQFAIAKVGSNTLIFLDGVLVSTQATGTPALTANSTPLNFGNGASSTMYACPSTILHRIYAENLTTSGLTAAAVVAADYAANSSRFV